MSKNRLNLLSILEAIAKIQTYSSPFEDAQHFYHDAKSFDATMMQFVVIAEMIDKLDDAFKANHTNIPWQKIKDFRNIVAHNYFGIDADEIWEIIHKHIPMLQDDIQSILDNL